MSGRRERARSAPCVEAVASSLRLFRSQPLGVRLFAAARRALAPLPRILEVVPESGRVLDLGCGHGLFSCAMAIGSPARSVLGIDPSPAKITVARDVGAGLPNVSFRQARVTEIEGETFDVITILDVLYLLDRDEKLAVLGRCRELLAADGVLVVKTNDTRPRWKYLVAHLQERAMIVSGLTLGSGRTWFLGREENRSLLERAGFCVRLVDLNSWLPYPHVMFIGGAA